VNVSSWTSPCKNVSVAYAERTQCLGESMKRFVQDASRTQTTLLPESLDDCVADTNPVRVVDVFVDELDLGKLGIEGVEPVQTGRPAYHPAV
jgi:transposase